MTTLTSGLPAFWHVSAWWNQPIVYGLDRDRITVREIEKLGRSAIDSNELFIDNVEVGDDEVVVQVGQGFRYLIDGLNSERIVVGLEGVGIGQAALELAAKYANERVVFDRPIGQNQAVAHPLANSWIRLESARLMAMHAAELYDDHQNCGIQAAAAKYLAPRPASMPATGPCPPTVATPTPRNTTWSGCGGTREYASLDRAAGSHSIPAVVHPASDRGQPASRR